MLKTSDKARGRVGDFVITAVGARRDGKWVSSEAWESEGRFYAAAPKAPGGMQIISAQTIAGLDDAFKDACGDIESPRMGQEWPRSL